MIVVVLLNLLSKHVQFLPISSDRVSQMLSSSMTKKNSFWDCNTCATIFETKKDVVLFMCNVTYSPFDIMKFDVMSCTSFLYVVVVVRLCEEGRN